MVNDKEQLNVKHLFDIANGINNPSREDDAIFSRTYEYIKDISGGSRLCSELNKAFIISLYPELERACEEYRIRAKIVAMSNLDNKSLGEKLDEAGNIVINKYNLSYTVKKSNKDEVRKKINVQKKMKKYLLGLIADDCCSVVSELASRYAQKVNTYDELGNFMQGFERASWVLTGKIEEKVAYSFLKLPGIGLGLDLLQLKKEGIITEEKIIDEQKFNQSEAVCNAKINDKRVDLSPQKMPSNQISRRYS
ncbi:MAG: hypothetical protein E7019_01955 [Alphaproteobacteria bacterium]|nr:hypothetical protein [Alphaproteobacteria bacterium]